MADLQPHVPETIENGFGDRLAPGGLLVGKQEQQVDVGLRRHQPAAIAAGGDDRHALGVGRHQALVEVLRRRLVQQADDRVVQVAQPLGAAAPVPVLQQLRLGGGASLREFALEKLGDRCAKGVVAALELAGQRLDLGADAHGIELRLDRRGLLGDDRIHAQSDNGRFARCHQPLGGAHGDWCEWFRDFVWFGGRAPDCGAPSGAFSARRTA